MGIPLVIPEESPGGFYHNREVRPGPGSLCPGCASQVAFTGGVFNWVLVSVGIAFPPLKLRAS